MTSGFVSGSGSAEAFSIAQEALKGKRVSKILGVERCAHMFQVPCRVFTSLDLIVAIRIYPTGCFHESEGIVTLGSESFRPVIANRRSPIRPIGIGGA